MNRPPTKLAEIYATPKTELAEDDLSFLRGMIDRPAQPSEPIDYSFLRNELSKRHPPPSPKKKGIELVEPQVKASTRGPKYIKSRTVSRQAQYTFDDLPFEVTSRATPSEPKETEAPVEEPPRKVRKPVSYVSWKYIGETDGVLGCLTGKVDAAETPTTLSRDLANIPYELDRYKVDLEDHEEAPPVVHPRDLFSMSIKNGTREQARRRTISRMKRHQEVEEPETMLFLETDQKLIPLTASRLNKV